MDPEEEIDWRDLLRGDAAARPTSEQGGGWQHVPTWDGAPGAEPDLPDEFPDEVQFGSHDIVLPEEHITGNANPDADLDSTSVWDDLRSAFQLNPNPHVPTDAAMRLGRRALRGGSELVGNPRAALSGLADAGTLGWADELAGAQHAHPVASALLGSVPVLAYEGFAQSPEYTSARDAVREADESAADYAPVAHGVGELAGTLAPALLTGGTSAEAQAAVRARPFLSTLARGAGEGLALGGVAGAGSSDATGSDLATDTALSALAGGVGGGVAAGVPAGFSALRGRAGAAREAADLARVASVGGGRGTISRTEPRIAEFARLPGGISGQAQRIRRLGLVGALESPEAVAERSRGVLERLLATGDMATTRRRLAEDGTEVPVRLITDALEREAQSAEGMATSRPYARPARDLAQRFTDTYASTPATTLPATEGGAYRTAPEMVEDLDATIPYQRALDELRALDGEIPWTSERAAADAARGRRGAIRDALDNFVEEQLGPDAASRYREGRLDYQTARVAADQAAERVGRDAGNRSIGLTDVTAMTGARSIPEALQRLIMNRAAGTFGPTGRATGREMIARLLEAMPPGTSSRELEALTSRISPDLADRLRDAMREREAETSADATDPFAELGAVPDETSSEEAPTAPADDPFAALGAVPEEEEER